MNQITNEKTFIEETRPKFRLLKYKAFFDVFDEEIDSSFYCVENKIEEMESGNGILGIVMELTFADDGKMPDTPESTMNQGCKITCSKTGEEFEFSAPYYFLPMKRQSDGSYLISMLFYCESNRDEEDDYDPAKLEEKFKDNIAKVNLKVVAQNGFTTEEFSLVGDMVIDGEFHEGTALQKEDVTCTICGPESLTFYGEEN